MTCEGVRAISSPGGGPGDRVGLGEIKALGDIPDAHLITPVSITQTQGNTLGSYPAINLIDNSGFTGVPTAEDYQTFKHPGGPASTWVTGTGVYPNNYFSAGQVAPQFVFTLADLEPLTHMVVWGYGGNSNEATDFTVEFSDDGGATWYASVDVASQFLVGEDMTTLSFEGIFEADAVRVTMTDNAGSRGFGGSDRATASDSARSSSWPTSPSRPACCS